jgi:cellulose synthase/poly-beta-1,6-N-acetylglucosamine synthase-like glycosyltransferase
MIFYFDIFAIFYFVCLNSFYGLLLLLSIPEMFKRYKERGLENTALFKNDMLFPPVSIIAPAYNEEISVVDSVSNMLNLNYPQLEVVVCNDGSTDNTLQILIDAFSLVPVTPAVIQKITTKPVKSYYRSRTHSKLFVIDKENGGKADSLNAGINATTSPLFMAIDADTIVEKDAIRHMVPSLLTGKGIVALGGTIRIANECKIEKGQIKQINYPRHFLPAIQVVEYLRAYLFGRTGFNRLGGNLVISGAFGIFDKRAVSEIGGYSTKTVGEDLEIIMRLYHQRLKKKQECFVKFIGDTVAWTEVPDNLATLGRQRERWHRGLMQSLWLHREMLFNPKYGLIGFLIYPYLLFGELLAPVVELLGLMGFAWGLYVGAINWEFFYLFLAASWGLSMLFTILTIIVDEATFGCYKNRKDLVKMILYAGVESFGYRQMSLWWRLTSFYSFATGKMTWGKMERKGFKDS